MELGEEKKCRDVEEREGWAGNLQLVDANHHI